MLEFFLYPDIINNLLHQSPNSWKFVGEYLFCLKLIWWFKSSCYGISNSDHQSLTHSDMNNTVLRSRLAFFYLGFVFVYQLCIGRTAKLASNRKRLIIVRVRYKLLSVVGHDTQVLVGVFFGLDIIWLYFLLEQTRNYWTISKVVCCMVGKVFIHFPL